MDALLFVLLYLISGLVVARFTVRVFDADEDYAIVLVLLWPLVLLGVTISLLARLARWFCVVGRC